MILSIKECKLENQTRVKLLLQDAVPVYWPNLYILKRMRVKSPNTQQRFLSDLLVFFTWLNSENIDLESRLKSRPDSQYLDDKELSRFASIVHWKKETLNKLFSGFRLHPAAYGQVGATQAEARIITAQKYLAFLYENLGHSKDRSEQIIWMNRRLGLSIKEMRPTWKRRPLEPKGLTQEQEDTLIHKLHPNSEENPWPRSEALRVRNYLILTLLLCLGIRRGEMLGIKLCDIDYRQNRISIISRPNDVDDPRESEPRVKTHERKLPVPEQLMAMINLYIERYRGSFRAKKHPYLILAHGKREGAPLSIKSVDAVFNTAKGRFPVLEGITPHSLRHHDVYRTLNTLKEQTKDLPIEDRMQQERRVLTYKYGWSDHSDMPSLYGQKHYQEEADKAMKNRNAELLVMSSQRDEK